APRGEDRAQSCGRRLRATFPQDTRFELFRIMASLLRERRERLCSPPPPNSAWHGEGRENLSRRAHSEAQRDSRQCTWAVCKSALREECQNPRATLVGEATQVNLSWREESGRLRGYLVSGFLKRSFGRACHDDERTNSGPVPPPCGLSTRQRTCH